MPTGCSRQCRGITDKARIVAAAQVRGRVVCATNRTIGNTSDHAEHRLLQKMRRMGVSTHGAEVVVVRIRGVDMEFGCSKPCRRCTQELQRARVRVVYYVA